jgi:hypothetical protein
MMIPSTNITAMFVSKNRKIRFISSTPTKTNIGDILLPKW